MRFKVYFIVTVAISSLMLYSPELYAGDPAPGYVGSLRCSVCHPGIFNQWKTTLHSDIYKPPEPEKMIADWSGEVVLSNPGANIPPTTFILNNNGGNGPFTVTFLGQTFTVDRIHGGRALDRNEDPNNPNMPGRSKYIGKQRYHTKIGDNYMILPLQWNPIPNLDGNNGGWVPYHIEDWITPAGAFEPKLESQSEERRCAGCHQTGVQIAFDDVIKRYDLGVIEENIACEACHGPGEQHAMTANPQFIVNPDKLPTVAQKIDVCGRCHNRVASIEQIGGRSLGYPYNNGRSMQPGDLVEDFAIPAAGLWAGGISKQHHQQRVDFIGHDEFQGSAHARAGMTCFSCHNPHGSEFEHDLVASARDNSLCLSCHGEMFPEANSLALHSRHPAGEGSPNCVDCHMSAAQKSAVEFDIHQHNFKVLSPAQTLEFAQPNACAMCHRSYQGTTDTNIAVWNEDSDIVINTWLNERFQDMFGTSNIKQWEIYR